MILLAAAWARPTDLSGTWSFDGSDVITSVDGPLGLARVWYSTEGTNATLLDDADKNGIPDFPELVASTTEDVLDFYEVHGFRAPLSDEGRGGSDAMDVFLVDFAGNADGLYSPEVCEGRGPVVCSGYFVMENDFRGYGYSDLGAAIRVLTSHELFHAVQAAYNADTEVWWSEGSAVWAEKLYDPESEDFLWFADAYLEDTGRSLDQPPAGPVPTFAYATALWWYYLTERHSEQILLDLLLASETPETLLVSMSALEEAGGSSLREDWITFVTWNLATGRRAGASESWAFAAEVGPPAATAEGPAIEVDHRFYPLAASYFELAWEGGPLSFALEEPAAELHFALHPVEGSGDVLPALFTWEGDETPVLGDLAAGTYWLLGTNPTLAENSTKVLTCLGADVSACVPVDTGPAETAAETGEKAPAGCGCATDGRLSGASLLLALLYTRRRGSDRSCC